MSHEASIAAIPSYKNKEQSKIGLVIFVLIRLSYALLPVALLLGSCFTLSRAYTSGFGSLTQVAVAFLSSVGVIVGLFYSVENIQRIIRHKVATFYYGLGDKITTLNLKQVTTLVAEADFYYHNYAIEARIQPNIAKILRNVITVRGFILAVGGALLGLVLLSVSSWFVLGGVILAIISPYVISIIYYFTCSYTYQYIYRCEFIRQEMPRSIEEVRLSSEISKLGTLAETLALPVAYWKRFTVIYPVVSGLLTFALGRGQLLLWGFLLSSAILPFIAVDIASGSMFELLMEFFAGIGWAWGWETSLTLMSVFNQWNLPNTLADFIRLAIMNYALGVLAVIYLLHRYGVRFIETIILGWLFAPLAFWVCLPFYPIFRNLNMGRFRFSEFREVTLYQMAYFWRMLFYLWVISASIGALSRFFTQ